MLSKTLWPLYQQGLLRDRAGCMAKKHVGCDSFSEPAAPSLGIEHRAQCWPKKCNVMSIILNSAGRYTDLALHILVCALEPGVFYSCTCSWISFASTVHDCSTKTSPPLCLVYAGGKKWACTYSQECSRYQCTLYILDDVRGLSAYETSKLYSRVVTSS